MGELVADIQGVAIPDAAVRGRLQPYAREPGLHRQQLRWALERKRKPSSSKPLPAEALELAEQYSEAVSLCFPRGRGRW